MKKMSKFLSAMLAFCMLFAMTAISSEAVVIDNPTNGVRMVADFSKSEMTQGNADIGTGVYMVHDFGFEDSNNSLYWRSGYENIHFYNKSSSTALGWGDTLYFRVYCEYPTTVMPIFYSDNATGSPWASQANKQTWPKGWSIQSWGLNYTMANSPGWKWTTLDRIDITSNGYGITEGTYEQVLAGEKQNVARSAIYFDSVWLASSSAVYHDPNTTGYEWVGLDSQLSGASYITNLASVANKNNFVTGTLCYDLAKEDGTDAYLKIKPGQENGATRVIYDSPSSVTNNASYWSDGGRRYVTVWIYSPHPQTGGLYIKMSGSNGASGTWGWDSGVAGYSMVTDINWTGWKAFMLPRGGSANYLYQVRLEWLNTTDNGSRNGSYGEWTDDEAWIGLGHVYLAYQSTEGSYPTAYDYPEGTYSSYLKEGTVLLDAADSTTYNDSELTRSREAYHVYPVSLKSATFGNQYSGSTEKSTATVTLTDKSTCLCNIDADSYLNFWMMNPMKKLDAGGQTSAYTLRTTYADGSTHDTTVIGNWSGWKLISLPAAAFGYDAAKTMTKIELVANEADSSPSVTYTDAELTAGYSTSQAANGWADIINYFYLESAWLTDSAPCSFDTANVTVPSERVATDAAAVIYTADRNIGSVDGAVKVVKESDLTDVSSSFSLQVTDNKLSLIPSGKLDANTKYNVVMPNIYDTNGCLYDEGCKSFSFNTVTWAIGTPTQKDGYVSVACEGSVPDSIRLMAAVYSNSTEEKLLTLTFGSYSENDGALRVAVPTLSTGQSVRYFLWDMATLKVY